MKDLEKLEDMPAFEQIRNPKSRRNKKQTSSKRKAKKFNEHIPSYMECAIASHLAIMGIKYVMEKTWSDLVSVLFGEMLPVDFWLPDHKVVIEFDGCHHWQRMNGDKSYSLDRRMLNDKTRELFCIQRGFRLLRITSAEAGDYKEIINKFLDIK